MAIYIVEGKPGSGKTYFCVSHMLRKYYVYDDLIDEYVSRSSITLITNIDSLLLSHINLDSEIEKHGLSGVFSLSYIRSLRDLHKSKHIVFVIDESQRYFHRKFYDKDVFFFFQYHRHEGVDLYLVTQDVNSLPREIRSLSEYYIHAVSRTMGSGMAFRYKYISNDEVVKNKILKRDKSVFSLYRSMNFDEIDKPKPVYRKYILFSVVFFAIVLFGFFGLFLPNFGPKSSSATRVMAAQSTPKKSVQPPSPKKSFSVIRERRLSPVPSSSCSVLVSSDTQSGDRYEVRRCQGRLYSYKNGRLLQ